MAEAMAGAPVDATPVAVAGLALDAAAGAIGHRRDFYRLRQVVVDANVELQERELMKLADLADVLAAGLRERDVPAPEARLVAEAGITVLGVGFHRWVSSPDDTVDLGATLREVLGELLALRG
jgi:hypothetical protein